MKILVVDDEKLLVKGITFNLQNEGYEVEAAYDGATAVELARRGDFDLIILDWMMPEKSGSEACMEIRTFSDVPIIMLTAKSEDSDKIMGFACGADDYVTKPFNILELKARSRALLRRASGSRRQQKESSLLECRGFTLDMSQRVALREGRVVDLTAKEYELLEVLMKNPRHVFSREKLMDRVWGYTYAGDYRTVDVHIRRLREKLEPDPAQPKYILTKWGVGYYFQDEELSLYYCYRAGDFEHLSAYRVAEPGISVLGIHGEQLREGYGVCPVGALRPDGGKCGKGSVRPGGDRCQPGDGHGHRRAGAL